MLLAFEEGVGEWDVELVVPKGHRDGNRVGRGVQRDLRGQDKVADETILVLSGDLAPRVVEEQPLDDPSDRIDERFKIWRVRSRLPLS